MRRFPGTLLVAAAAALSLALAFATWRAAEAQQENEARAVFEFRVREIAQALGGRMHDYEQVLRGAAGLLAASQEVSAREWRVYVRTLRLDSSYPGFQGIGYATYERGDGPGVARVRYVEPPARNAVGFDLMSEFERRRALERARDTGIAVLTGKIRLLAEPDDSTESGFVMFLPVYRAGDRLATFEERRARFTGAVYASFRATNLFRVTIGEPSGLHLRLLDVSDPSSPQLLYEDTREAVSARYERAEAVVVRGRTWRLEARSRPAFEALIVGDRARVVLSAGIALSALFTALVWSLVNTRAHARELARGMVAASEERDRFRFAVDRHWDTMLMVDAARMRIVYANEGACRNLGYARDELIGQSAAIVFVDRDEAQLARLYGTLSADEAMVERSAYRRKDGSVFPVEISRQLIRTASTSYVLGVARDITARLEAERSLRESEARLALSLESSGIALFDWDLQSNLVHLGKEWRLLLGGEAEATVTPIQKLQQLVHPDDLPALQAQLRKLLAGEIADYRVEHRVRTVDGQWKWIESVAKVSGRDVEGRATRVTGTNSDISLRRAVGELKNAFIANVSHELRTPLTGIVASLDLLKEGAAGELPEQARQFVDIAHGNSERLGDLIDDILDLEQIETGRLRLAIRPVAVGELLARTMDLNTPYAERHQARLVTRDVAPGLKALADEDRLLQVLTNLVSNAAKHSPPGGEIDLAARPEGERVIFSVADQGEGIAEEFKPRIFGKFEQADHDKPGTGLGLAIAKAMVEKMGGEIRFESERGRGATFYVELPIARP